MTFTTKVPQLVDACTRNGFHEEALELANFVNGLERRHLLASEVGLLHLKVSQMLYYSWEGQIV
jgi:hypothetical protein